MFTPMQASQNSHAQAQSPAPSAQQRFAQQIDRVSRRCPAVLVLLCLCAIGSVQAAENNDATAFVQTLKFQTGNVKIASAHATLEVDGGYRFLDTGDARRVLEDLWGNPPDASVLGMLVPDAAPLDSEQSWAVVLTYSDEGHVGDEDANEIDYSTLLSEMQDATRAHNEQRVAAGYGAMELVGWAQPPRYDSASHKLHWAKELSSSDSNGNFLNYDVRVLGREGFLSMNAVADIKSLAQVNASMDSVLAMARFDEGHRYNDYNASTDRAAGYGLAALIGGGMAAKSGLLAKLGILLLKFWKLGLLGVVLIGGFIGKLLGRNKSEAN
jgi:uncharacterized membrane-anchored protein